MRFGNEEVEELLRPGWEPERKCLCRNFSKLKDGETWNECPYVGPNTWQTFVIEQGNPPLPAEIFVARELKEAGASLAYVVEAYWSPPGVMDHAMYGTKATDSINVLLRLYKQANKGSYGGFPDVIAFWDNGIISAREVKLFKGDSIKENQHNAANTLREMIGSKLDLKVVTWGHDFPHKLK
jgi:hypothetical protein